MADTTWPSADLPTSPQYGWTETPGSSLVRTETDAGPAKLRRRFSSSPSLFSLMFTLTTAQATRLEQFYSNAADESPAGTNGGALSFDGLPHPRTNSAATWRFTSAPTLTQVTFTHYRVTVALELLP